MLLCCRYTEQQKPRVLVSLAAVGLFMAVGWPLLVYYTGWAGFVKFTHNILEELATGYGPIDIFWLDGGQVRPPRQDINMPASLGKPFNPNA